MLLQEEVCLSGQADTLRDEIVGAASEEEQGNGQKQRGQQTRVRMFLECGIMENGQQLGSGRFYLYDAKATLLVQKKVRAFGRQWPFRRRRDDGASSIGCTTGRSRLQDKPARQPRHGTKSIE